MNSKLQKGLSLLVIVVFLACSLAPFVCMAFDQPIEGLENRVPTPFPSLFQDGRPNVNFMADLGAWFNDHFAFRQQLVTANAKVTADVLGESSGSSVIVGKDGWLFYVDTVNDYLGKDLMSGRQIYNAATNLRLMSEYAAARGASFFFTISPNKNSLYPAYMPDRYVPLSSDKNAVTLAEALDGVAYVDLFAALQAESDILYHPTDSHWNNRGAVMAYNAILSATGKAYDTYADAAVSIQNIHRGDLEIMLYPRAVAYSEEYVYDIPQTYTYMVGDSPESTLAVTSCEGKAGSLVMYRDSFGNTLLPLMAEQFGTAAFSRQVPYDLSLIDQYQADVVVFEIVERSLSFFQWQVPVMIAPERDMPDVSGDAACTTLATERTEAEQGHLTGVVSDPAQIDDDSPIYICLTSGGETRCYEASLRSMVNGGVTESEYGFEATVPAEAVAGDTVMRVIAQKDGAWRCIGTQTF